jgi:hypothetical protein
MSEQTLVDKAQAAVGTADTILAAAAFQPRGTDGGLAGGHALGESVGHAFGGGVGGALGGLVGAAIGVEEVKKAGGLSSDSDGALNVVPWESLVAVSKDKVYGWRLQLQGMHTAPTEPLFALDRSDIAITVHNRVGVHTFELQDLAAGTRWEFEGNRINSHAKALMAELHEVPVTELSS